MIKKKIIGQISEERLFHFKCGKCRRWWSIADAKLGKGGRTKFFCPWCGLEQGFKKSKI